MKNASSTAQNMAKSANGAAVSISEIPKQSKAAKIGLNALSVAGNMLFNVGIMLVISKMIEGIQWLATSSERAKEAAEELSDELKSQKESIDGNTSTLEGLQNEFNSLSNGVDDYGKNISLSAEEYQRYQDIVQQVVDISPSLIKGYDEEGRAIANKNGLIEQSIALLKEENRRRIETATSEDTITTLGKGDVEKYKDVAQEVQNKRTQTPFWVSGNYIQAEDKNEKLLEIIGITDKKPWGLNDTSFYGDKLRDNYDVLFQNFDKIIEYNDKLKNMGQPTLLNEDEIDRLENWAKVYGETEKELEIASKTLNSSLQIIPQSLTVYGTLSDKQKDFISEYINTFKIGADTTEKDIKKMRQDILDFTEAIGNASPETKKAIEDLFSLDRSKISATEFEKQADDLINQIVNSLEFDSENDKNEFTKKLKIRVGLEFTTDGNTTVKTMVDGVKAKLQDEFDDKVDDLSLDELKVAYNIMADLPEGTLLSWDELQEKINATSDSVNGVTSSLEDLEKVSDNIGKLSSAYKELNDDGYITIGTINDIKEATGLSGDEWTAYETKLLNAKKGSAEFNQVMSDLTYKIIENQVSVDDLTNATDEEVAAIEKKIAATLRENGVTNASAVAHDYVTKKINEEKAATVAAAMASGQYTGNLKNVANECGMTANAFAALTLKMIKLNNTKLNFYQQIQQIRALRTAMGLASDVNGSSLGIKRKQGTVGEGYSYNGKWYNDWNEAYEQALADETDKIFGAVEDYDVKPVYADTSTKSSGSDKSDKNDALDDYLEQARKDYADNQVKDLEHIIEMTQNLKGENADVLEYYNQIQDIAHNEADRLRSVGYDDNSDEIQEWQSKWWAAQDKKMDFYSKQHDTIISDIEHARDMALAKEPNIDTTLYNISLCDIQKSAYQIDMRFLLYILIYSEGFAQIHSYALVFYFVGDFNCCAV